MSKGRKARNGLRMVVAMLSGAMVLGTSCAGDVRQSIVAGSLDFIEGSTSDILAALFPIEEVVAGE